MSLISITEKEIEKFVEAARLSERKRIIFNYHTYSEDTMQRMINAIEPGSYVQPHKHENPDKSEVFLILKGKLAVVIYDSLGEIEDCIMLDREKGNFGVEVPPCTWHSIIAFESGTVVYEVKHGPYDPANDKVFASWAPAENHPQANEYLLHTLKKLNRFAGKNSKI